MGDNCQQLDISQAYQSVLKTKLKAFQGLSMNTFMILKHHLQCMYAFKAPSINTKLHYYKQV